MSNNNKMSKMMKMTEKDLKEATDATIVGSASNEKAPPKLSQETADELWKKHSNRGQMAVEMVKSLGATDTSLSVDELIQKSFDLVDGIQAEIDRGYNSDIIAAHVSASQK
jgi:hypothetical protein